jgi:hypothetical protein
LSMHACVAAVLTSCVWPGDIGLHSRSLGRMTTGWASRAAIRPPGPHLRRAPVLWCLGVTALCAPALRLVGGIRGRDSDADQAVVHSARGRVCDCVQRGRRVRRRRGRTTVIPAAFRPLQTAPCHSSMPPQQYVQQYVHVLTPPGRLPPIIDCPGPRTGRGPRRGSGSAAPASRRRRRRDRRRQRSRRRRRMAALMRPS